MQRHYENVLLFLKNKLLRTTFVYKTPEILFFLVLYELCGFFLQHESGPFFRTLTLLLKKISGIYSVLYSLYKLGFHPFNVKFRAQFVDVFYVVLLFFKL